MSKDVNATLRFVDKFTLPFNKAIQNMERGQKQAKRLGKEIEETGKTISKVGNGMKSTFTTPIIDAGLASFNLASDLQESMNKVDSTFGNNAKNVKEWSKDTLKNYGLSQGAALEMATTYGDMAESMGLSSTKASNMSRKLTGLAGDLASCKNISAEVASTALTGIFTGETESLKQLGISMSKSNLDEFAKQKGMKKTVDQMSEAEQVQLRYKYVLQQTKDVQGNFAKTSGSVANQQRSLSEGVKQLGASFGQILLPAGTKLLVTLNKLITKFNGLSNSQKTTITKITGMIASIGPLLIITGKLTTGIGKVVKSTGDIVKSYKKAKELVTDLKNAFSKERLETIKDTANKVKDNIVTIAGNVAKKAGAAATWAMVGAQKALNFAFVSTPIGWIVLGIGALITVGVLLVKNWNKIKNSAGELWKKIKNTFSSIGDCARSILEVMPEPFKEFINEVFSNINKIPQLLNSIKITLPPFMGGGKVGFNIPLIPYLAKGTNSWQGGLAITQEKGGEIMDLPRGTRVYPHDETVKMAHMEGKKSAAKSITINKLADKIEVRSQADIDTIVEKLADKLQKIINNGGGEVYA